MPSLSTHAILFLGLLTLLLQTPLGRRHHVSFQNPRVRDSGLANRIHNLEGIEDEMKDIYNRLHYSDARTEDDIDNIYADRWMMDNVYLEWHPMEDSTEQTVSQQQQQKKKETPATKKKLVTKVMKPVSKKEHIPKAKITAADEKRLAAVAKQKKWKAEVRKDYGFHLEHWTPLHGTEVKVLYHATNAKAAIEESMATLAKFFGPKASKYGAMKVSSESKALGAGIYFCDDPKAAAIKSQGGNNFIVAATVLLGRPLVYDDYETCLYDTLLSDDEFCGKNTWAECVEYKQADSVILKEIYGTYDEEKELMKEYDLEFHGSLEDVPAKKRDAVREKLRLYRAAEYVVYRPRFVRIDSIKPKAAYDIEF